MCGEAVLAHHSRRAWGHHSRAIKPDQGGFVLTEDRVGAECRRVVGDVRRGDERLQERTGLSLWVRGVLTLLGTRFSLQILVVLGFDVLVVVRGGGTLQVGPVGWQNHQVVELRDGDLLSQRMEITAQRNRETTVHEITLCYVTLRLVVVLKLAHFISLCLYTSVQIRSACQENVQKSTKCMFDEFK